MVALKHKKKNWPDQDDEKHMSDVCESSIVTFSFFRHRVILGANVTPVFNSACVL